MQEGIHKGMKEIWWNIETQHGGGRWNSNKIKNCSAVNEDSLKENEETKQK